MGTETDAQQGGLLRLFNPRDELAIWSNRLPHWQQDGSTVFVTFRLADSLPQHLLAPWQEARDAWRVRHPPPWNDALEREFHERFSAPVDRWLDAGHGACLLRAAACAEAVAAVLRHDEDKACRHLAWVVMPNHMHAVFTLREASTLDRVLKTWKGVSARRINELCGRSGALWQRDYFDRLVRDETHLARCVRYIRRNPEKAGLRPGEYLLFESEAAQRLT